MKLSRQAFLVSLAVPFISAASGFPDILPCNNPACLSAATARFLRVLKYTSPKDYNETMEWSVCCSGHCGNWGDFDSNRNKAINLWNRQVSYPYLPPKNISFKQNVV